MKSSSFRRWGVAAWTVAALGIATSVLYADHSWGNFHWFRTANPLALKIGDNVTAAWDPYLTDANDDWNESGVLENLIVAGSGVDPKKCSPTNGRVEICNASYGGRGWLGVASIWASGDHIVQATVKMNDFYFDSPLYPYNTALWRQSVMCQEIGHIFGLDHQDEDFNNDTLYTCMDYQDPPFPSPNTHDFDQLTSIYTHLDTTGGGGGSGGGGGKGKSGGSGLPPGFTGLDVSGPGQWGRQVAISRNGLEEVFEADFGGGNRIITFVRWVSPEERARGLQQ